MTSFANKVRYFYTLCVFAVVSHAFSDLSLHKVKTAFYCSFTCAGGKLTFRVSHSQNGRLESDTFPHLPTLCGGFFLKQAHAHLQFAVCDSYSGKYE